MQVGYDRSMNHLGPYWRGVTQRLQAEVDQMNQLIGHQGTKGTENELALARIVERLVPSRFGVGSGLVVDHHGNSSAQMDLIVFDRGNESTLFAQTNQVLYPVETVLLCVEVKTSLTKTEIDDARKKKKSLEVLESKRSKPAFALFGYRGGITAKAIVDNLQAESIIGSSPDMTVVVSLALMFDLDEGVGKVAAYNKRGASGEPLLGDPDTPSAAETGNEVIREGNLLPVVAVPEYDHVVGEPSRALLLFAEWVSNVLTSERADSVISSYIQEELRDAISLGQ